MWLAHRKHWINVSSHTTNGKSTCLVIQTRPQMWFLRGTPSKCWGKGDFSGPPLAQQLEAAVWSLWCHKSLKTGQLHRNRQDEQTGGLARPSLGNYLEPSVPSPPIYHVTVWLAQLWGNSVLVKTLVKNIPNPKRSLVRRPSLDRGELLLPG